MARVFQAYDCRDAMHLDMNALYRASGPDLVTEHLVAGMEVLDEDFFYLVRRQGGGAG